MELLLKTDTAGNVVEGAHETLMERARRGDDITLYEESSVFNCYIVFPNYALEHDRISGLSLPHVAHGELSDPATLGQRSLTTIQYIYDSRSRNLLCKDMLDEHLTLTEIWV